MRRKNWVSESGVPAKVILGLLAFGPAVFVVALGVTVLR